MNLDCLALVSAVEPHELRPCGSSTSTWSRRTQRFSWHPTENGHGDRIRAVMDDVAAVILWR